MRLKYIQPVVAKGKTYWYFRRGGRRIALPGSPGEVEFHSRYQELLEQFSADRPEAAERYKPGTLGAIIADYKTTPEYKDLSDRSKENYNRYMDYLGQSFGHHHIKTFTAPVVEKLRNKFQDTPGKANNIMTVMSVLMVRAIRDGHRADNPCSVISRLKTGEYEPWPDEVLAAARAAASPMLRLAIELHLYTGQRISDVCRMTHHDIKDGEIDVVQQKTKKRVLIPIHRNLAERMRQVPRKSIHILYNRYYKPFSPDTLRERLERLMNQLGEYYVFHGLRKNAVIALLELGCTEYETMSITGQHERMVRHYAKQIRQNQLAQNAMRKWESGKPIRKKWQTAQKEND